MPTIITNKKLRGYLHRLASIEQHVRGVQAKLYICNEDARKYFENEGMVFFIPLYAHRKKNFSQTK